MLKPVLVSALVAAGVSFGVTTVLNQKTIIVEAPEATGAAVDEAQMMTLMGDFIDNNAQRILDSVQKHQEGAREREKAQQGELVIEHHDLVYNADHSPSVGPKDAVVTLVEFYDYNCPACKTMFKSLDEVVSKYPKDLRVIFKEFPIFGKQSDDNAKVAFAVNRIAPHKFFDWHSIMMSNKERSDLEYALKAVETVGLSRAQVEKEMQNPELESLIAKDRELAQLLKIRGTPAAIIGDKVFPGAVSASDLSLAIEEFKKQRDEVIKKATGGVIQNQAE